MFLSISLEQLALKTFNPHLGLKGSTVEVCSLFEPPSF